MFLAGKVKKVWMVVRGASLEATMSQYLVDRIRALPNVEVVTRTEICGLEGDGRRCWSRCAGRTATAARKHAATSAMSFPSSAPIPTPTGWRIRGVTLDDKGFVITGADGRHLLATSRDGVFAVGDVRCGSVKRVAAAVGEGSTVVSAIHALLAERRAAPGAEGGGE